MRLAWWGFVVIGLALMAVGAFTTLTSQSTISYCRSLIKTVACGMSNVGPAQPRFFMSQASAVTLQEAELAWVVGIVIVGLGLVSMTYGVLSQSKPEPVPLTST
jgi:hypothetical protein